MEIAQWRWHKLRRTINGGHDDGRHILQAIWHAQYGASTVEERQRLIITSCVNN
jgi:hypothetical protein